VDRIDLSGTNMTFHDPTKKQPESRKLAAADHKSAANSLIDWLEKQNGFESVQAVGHRVVHGMQHTAPEVVTQALLDELHRISPNDPDHLPREIELIEMFRQRHPKLPQVACFDTAFHQTMPRVAKLLPIPRRFDAKGIQRYGFHGLSYAYLMEELTRLGDPAAKMGRVILAHLGNGASMAAVRDGNSIDTSMCFTPTAGLVMSNRSGDLDPGLAPYLARTEQMTTKQFYEMVNHKSGLLGVSETSSDMRDLLDQEKQDVRAAEAVALFCYQAKKWIGAYAAALGGLHTLVFAGGIGENAPAVRVRICEGLSFLGLELNESRNAEAAAVISMEASRVTVRVIRTDEELMIARSVVSSCPEVTADKKKLYAHESHPQPEPEKSTEHDKSMNATQTLHNLGQSLWLDNITRDLLTSGTLKHYIDELSVTGLTSNPTIFDHALKNSAAYDAAIREELAKGKAGEALFFDLALDDLTRAADLFRPVHDRTNRVDGWVSLEVSPLLAHNTVSTIAAAKELSARAGRPNLFIKIPGTKEGLPAIEEAIFAGVPVNVTLLFSREQYVAAAEAYLRGIERRMAAGLNPEVGSVASMFISRWDVAVADKVPEALHNRLGIAIAARTYKAYVEVLRNPRWQRAYNAGARPQRLLWASTGTKDPKASDLLYIKALASPFTVNTMPEETLKALADHGELGKIMAANGGGCEKVLAGFAKAGINVDGLAAQLQDEGAKSFVKSWNELLAVVASKSAALKQAA
jgi:transaldolase